MAAKDWYSADECGVGEDSMVAGIIGVKITGVFVAAMRGVGRAVSGVGVIVGKVTPLHAVIRTIKTLYSQIFFMQYTLPKTKPGQA